MSALVAGPDGNIDIRDVDLLWAQLRSVNPDVAFDLNGDQRVDERDRDRMIKEVLKTNFGDANLDRVFNSSDFVLVFRIGEYEDGTTGNSTWGDGDWNGDGEFSTADLVLSFQNGGYLDTAKPAAADLVLASKAGTLVAESTPAEIAAAIDLVFEESDSKLRRAFIA